MQSDTRETIQKGMQDNKEFEKFLQSTQLYQPPKTHTSSEIEFKTMLKEPLFVSIDNRKSQLHKLLCELLKLNREITRLTFSITSAKERIQFQNIMLESQKYAVQADSSLDSITREYTMMDADKQIETNINDNNIETSEMEVQKQELEKRLKCCLRSLSSLKKVFQKEHKMMMDKMKIFMTKVSSNTVGIVKDKMKYLDDNYKREMHALNEYQNKFAGTIIDEDPCTDVLDIFESTETSSNTCSTTFSSCSVPKNNSLSLNANAEKQEDHDFIKMHLAKPLIQGMAAITMLQPADPIFFLSTFLEHFRHNQMMHCRKELNFQMLLEERRRAALPKEPEICMTCENLLNPNPEQEQQ